MLRDFSSSKRRFIASMFSFDLPAEFNLFMNYFSDALFLSLIPDINGLLSSYTITIDDCLLLFELSLASP